MTTYLVAVTRQVADVALPTGVTALGSTLVHLLNAADRSVAQTVIVTDGSLVSSFSGVIEGSYIAQAQDLDSTGANLGTAVEVAFDVPAVTPPATTYKATSALSVAVTQEQAA